MRSQGPLTVLPGSIPWSQGFASPSASRDPKPAVSPMSRSAGPSSCTRFAVMLAGSHIHPEGDITAIAACLAARMAEVAVGREKAALLVGGSCPLASLSGPKASSSPWPRLKEAVLVAGSCPVASSWGPEALKFACRWIEAALLGSCMAGSCWVPKASRLRWPRRSARTFSSFSSRGASGPFLPCSPSNGSGGRIAQDDPAITKC
jgi:hypothetical protein